MLYFMGYTDCEGNWTGNFTRTVRDELSRQGIPFKELPPYDWYTTKAPINYYLSIDSMPDDAWFISWAQSPLIELIKHKPGKKYGFVVGLTAMPFEPAVLMEASDNLRERKRLQLYDKIFVNSQWCKECICSLYPELAERVLVTGFPIDFRIYDAFRSLPKDENLVVFNQRFALEKLHILELKVAQHLIERGYRVQHLSGISVDELIKNSAYIKPLLRIASRIGLEFIYNKTKDEYHRNLAKASIVITTSIADMLPSSLIEAIYLGAVPIAPQGFCFPEFVNSDNLYEPYDINQILDIVNRRPVRNHPIKVYDKQIVVSNFLKGMGLVNGNGLLHYLSRLGRPLAQILQSCRLFGTGKAEN